MTYASPRGGLSFVGPQKKLCSADSIFGDRESPKTNGDADNVSTIALDNAGGVDEGFLKTKHHRVRMGKCTRATRKM